MRVRRKTGEVLAYVKEIVYLCILKCKGKQFFITSIERKR